MPTDRQYWTAQAARLARPVLAALAGEKLRASMPIEHKPERTDRHEVTHLEAFARLLAGISPWLNSNASDPERPELAGLASRALAVAVDPNSPDFLNFSVGHQPLVDAAFLAHAILRAPDLLWRNLDSQTQSRLVQAMLSSRRIRPGFNNWLLFAATVEAFLAFAGEKWDAMRVDYAIRQHMQWYKGDGIYGDGPHLHCDYYNSFVIQPMLLDVLAVVAPLDDTWEPFVRQSLARAQRFAVIQERTIAPDGSFPAVGRSIAYRCGCFQLLAQLALQKKLPDELAPAQVRSALQAVIARTLDAPNTFDQDGWLRIGLCGHQPAIGEAYISTGSLYLCSTALLPLGLPPTDEFWAAPVQKFTSQKIWSGENLPPDHAITD